MQKIKMFLLILSALFTALWTFQPISTAGVCFIAHRGYSYRYLQNTTEAFQKAGEAGFGGAETDVRMTSDGVFVLSHNETVVLKSGKELVVADNTFAALTAEPLKNRYTGTKLYLCTLQEYLEICKAYGMICFIELKDEWPAEKILDVFRCAQESYDLSRCEFQSFELSNLLVAHEAFPALRIMLTCEEWNADVEEALRLGFEIDMNYEHLTKEIVAQFHDRQLKVACYKANSAGKILYCASLGADYIESDTAAGLRLQRLENASCFFRGSKEQQ